MRNLYRKCQVKLVSWLFCTTWFDRCDLSPSEMEGFKGKNTAFVRELLVRQIPFILKLHAFQMAMSENESNRPFPSSKNSHFQIEAINQLSAKPLLGR